MTVNTIAAGFEASYSQLAILLSDPSEYLISPVHESKQ